MIDIRNRRPLNANSSTEIKGMTTRDNSDSAIATEHRQLLAILQDQIYISQKVLFLCINQMQHQMQKQEGSVYRLYMTVRVRTQGYETRVNRTEIVSIWVHRQKDIRCTIEAIYL